MKQHGNISLSINCSANCNLKETADLMTFLDIRPAVSRATLQDTQFNVMQIATKFSEANLM